jgi:hypothetical protein
LTKERKHVTNVSELAAYRLTQSHQSRQAGLKAARDESFTGKIARRIAQFVEETEALDATGTYHRALLGPQDLERYHARIEDQSPLQFFLNLTPFGMNLQEAVDAPSFHTLDFPSSFYPRKASPREVQIEDTIPTEVREDLERRGHILRVTPSWQNGRVTAAARDPRSGVVMAGASRKMMFGNTAHALGW